MGIPFPGIGANILSSQMVGQVWTPKSQRLVVGRDVSPLSATAFGEQQSRMVVANGDDTRYAANDLYGMAKAVAQSGLRAKNFRSVDTKNLVYSNDPSLADTGIAAKDLQSNRDLVTKHDVLMTRGDTFVTFSNGTLHVWQKKQDGTAEKVSQHAVTADTRVSWDKNDNVVVATGNQALTGGTLKAQGDGEILIRKSGVNVEAGEGSTVINLSGKGGTFTGGNNVTYLGAYSGCEISGGTGTTDYAGYFEGADIAASAGQGIFSGVFENLVIEAGELEDSFSGYFSGATVNGGDGRNDFRGMFLNGSAATGGGGDDLFRGRFIDSVLDAGEGDNAFGRSINYNSKSRIVPRKGEEYEGIESDFINSEVTAGSGKDTFEGAVWGGTVNLGDGDNTASGIFSEARVLSGKGNDTLAAVYSLLSTFEAGDGNDTVTLATAFGSTVHTGEGTTGVTLGRNIGGSNGGNGRPSDGNSALAGSVWQTGSEHLKKTAPKSFGELGANTVNAETGENIVTVNDGHGTQTVRTGDREDAEPSAAGDADSPAENAAGETASEDQAKLGQAIQSAGDNLSLIKGTVPSRETMPEEDTSAGHKKRQTALSRYARQSDDASLQGGTDGATIKTGASDDIRIRTYSSRNPFDMEEEGTMRRVTLRNTGFGYYQWSESRGELLDDAPRMGKFVKV